jgi:SsrA-binding protein
MRTSRDRLRTVPPARPAMSIVDNRKAFHDYFIEERFEAGLVLEGWEVKAIRAGRAQIKEAYVMLRGAEAYIIGMHVSPLPTASTHVRPDPTRTRKLLLHAAELAKLIGKVEQRGYTLVPLNLHYAKGRIKAEIGLAKGKKQHDKREAEKERDWQREKQRLMRRGS